MTTVIKKNLKFAEIQRKSESEKIFVGTRAHCDIKKVEKLKEI